ncbi:MAG: undecaprenyl-diphosphatase [Flavobacteriaceae bacterium]|nr:MAG: undecaprenyl-diphosphatase [Flavobacteriaceae bacterium]
MIFTIVVHGATALATLVVFRDDVWEIFRDLFRFSNNKSTQFSLQIILSMIPAGLVGFFFEEVIGSYFFGNILLVGLMLWVTAALLYIADKPSENLKKISLSKAWWIGVAQAFAILPGVSRSGATIATSLLLGVTRDKAARFSFLMVVPLILGSMVKKFWMVDLRRKPLYGPVIAGFIAAFVSGYLACQWMISLVKRSKLRYFAYYCAAVGTIAIVTSQL